MRTAIVVLAMAAGLAAQVTTKPGTERWIIKTGIPDGAKLKSGSRVDIADLIALPDASGITKDEKKYQTIRIPAQSGAKYAEGDVITTTGWLHLVAGETDGDYHIQMSDSATSGDPCLIVEVPNPDPEYTSATGVRPMFTAVRDLIKSKMLAGKDPSPSGSVMRHPVYVTVTGILFFDDSHVGDPPRGKKAMKAGTLWELHPVTAIAFAPKPR